MRLLSAATLLALVTSTALTAQPTPLARDGIVRVAYLASNPAQALKDHRFPTSFNDLDRGIQRTPLPFKIACRRLLHVSSTSIRVLESTLLRGSQGAA